jgi:hypothetical protein
MGTAFNLNLSADWGMFVNSGLGSSDLLQNLRADKDYFRYLPTTVKRLTGSPAGGVVLPTEARHAILIVANFPVRMRIGVTDATAAEGFLVPAGFYLFEDQRAFLESVSFIDTTAGASEVSGMYGW